jgi:DNA-directed RNA polymerase specialized sigma24 family protein
MTTVDTVLTHFRQGRATRREAVAALTRLITPANVEEVMTTLPEDIAEDLQRWAADAPAQGEVLLGANLSAAEAQQIAERSRVAVVAVRDWVARRRNRENLDGHGGDIGTSPTPSWRRT